MPQWKFFNKHKSCMKSIMEDISVATGHRGLKQFTSYKFHALEKIAWIIVFIFSGYGAYTSVMIQYNRYKDGPTVMSLDRNYRSWNGTLPAVTLCHSERVDLYKANEYIYDNWNMTLQNEEYFYFLEFVHSVVNATVTDFKTLASYAVDKRFENINLFEINKLVARTVEQIVTSFNENINVHVQEVMTERGLCYTINSPMSQFLNYKNIKLDKIDKPISCQYNRDECFIKLEILDNEASIEVHSPYEVSGSNAIITLAKSNEVSASYKIVETVASESLRDLKYSQRKCVFFDERTYQLPFYSKSGCLLKCRAIMALEMCNCVPFFYPFVDGPRCTPNGFECLLYFKWPLRASHICKCPITCTEQVFSMHSTKLNIWKGDQIAHLQSVSTFRWDVIPPKVRFRRDILFSFEDLIVSFGGAAAFFLGLSFWDVTNIIFVIFSHWLSTWYKCFLKIIRK